MKMMKEVCVSLLKTLVETASDFHSVIGHIYTVHERWKDFVIIEGDKCPPLGSVYLNPDWRSELEANFNLLIIEKCSLQTRDAWNNNKHLEDPSKFVEIRKEILNRLIDHIVSVYGITSTPSTEVLKEIWLKILSPGYPFMFKKIDDSRTATLSFGHGRGGKAGLDELPKQLWDKIHQKQRKMRGGSLINNDECSQETLEIQAGPSLKGRAPATYGINSYKYYSKGTDEEVAAVVNSKSVIEETLREEIYNKNRNAISEQISSSKKNVGKVVAGFFKSPLHLHNQFVYVTDGFAEVKARIASNLSTQVKNFEMYIRHVKPTLASSLDEISNRVINDYKGVQTYKDIHVI